MDTLRQHWMAWAAAVMAALVVLTTSVYTFHSSTAVPYWDMFDGTLWFETQFSQGSWAALWAQHNEHRIVLAKLLFLLDFQIANGTTPFLHIVNLLLAGAMAWVLLLYSRSINGGPRLSILNALIVALCFSILQKQNFVDAFQSQFFLAYLLPLLSLYFAHRSVEDGDNRWGSFVAAVVCAAFAIISMANGVFALPVLLVYGILMRFSRKRIALLAVLSALGFLLYFYGYQRVGAHTSPLDAIQDPKGLFLFLCAYMGHYIALGFFVILAAIGAFVYYLPKRRFHSAEVALVGFVGFVLLSATITALGRLSFGIGAAHAERYATPVFAALSALFILYRPMLRENLSAQFWRWQMVWRWPGFVLIIVVLLGQASTMRWVPERNFSHLMGALALELGLADQDTVGAIYPDAARALMLSTRAREVPQMIWAMAPIKDAKVLIGTKIDVSAPITCKFFMDKVTQRIANSPMQRWDGWIGLAADQMIYLTDEKGTVYGLGLVGGSRTDVQNVFAELGARTGFGLYAVHPLPKGGLFLGTKSTRCILSEQDYMK